MKSQRGGGTARIALVAIVVVSGVNVAGATGDALRVLGHIGGESRAVRVEGSYAYIGEGPDLTILDISNPAVPTALGRLLLPSTVKDVFTSAGLAYVATRENGLHIVDVSIPWLPMLLGADPAAGPAKGVRVSGSLAYVAAEADGLKILDVSDPASPALRGFYPFAQALEVFTTPGRAYVCAGPDGLQILDVSDPTSPTRLGSYPSVYAADVFVKQGLAYLSAESDGLRIVSVSDPTSPTTLGAHRVGDEQLGKIDVAGVHAYVADYAAGLRIYNVLDPILPTRTSTYGIVSGAADVSVSGTLAYTSAFMDGMLVLDVSDPAVPTREGTYYTTGYGSGVDVDPGMGMAYIADGPHGLLVIDVNDPHLPIPIGQRDTVGYAFGIDFNDQISPFVYVAGGQLEVFDVTNPSSPMWYDEYQTFVGSRDVAVWGDFAYVADANFGLQIIDVSIASTPPMWVSYDTPGFAQGVFYDNNLAYVADGIGGLQIIDVSSPQTPVLEGSHGAATQALKVHVDGTFAYVADGTNGLRIFDVSDPTSPLLHATYPTPWAATDVFVSGARAYVTDNEGVVLLLDVSDPSSPTLKGVEPTFGSPSAVYVAGDVAYVTDDTSGFWILGFVDFDTTPVAPTSLSVMAISPNQIELSWTDNSDNELGFEIERRQGFIDMWSQITTTAENVSHHIDSGLPPGTTFSYRVRAFNTGGHSPYSNIAFDTTFDVLPAAPTSLTAMAVSSSQIELTWSDNSTNEDNFLIERKTGVAGVWSQITTTTANVTMFLDGGRQPNTTYFYRVRAHNTSGNSAYSNEASATTFKVPPPAPSNLIAVAIASDRIDLIWNDNSITELGFQIERRIGLLGAWTQITTTTVSATSYRDTGLQPNTTYFYRVRAFNEVGNSPFSNEASATTLDVPPPAPSNLIAVAITSDRIDLTWNDNSITELGFKIERRIGAVGAWTQITTTTVSATSYRDTGLQPNTTYFYRVRAFNAVGNSPFSNEASATTPDVPPPAPSNLVAVAVASDRIDLIWNDNSITELGFKIERRIGAVGAWTQITTTTVSATSYRDTGVQPETTYFYRVRAYNAVGNSPFSNEASATTPQAPPAPPSGLVTRVVSSEIIDLTWTDNAIAELGFKIERKTGTGGTWVQIATSAANATSYRNGRLTPNTTYFYRVRAYNAGGDSPYSNEASATTLDVIPAAPSSLIATAVSSTRIDLTWTDNANNEQGFRIDRKIGTDGTWGQFTIVGPNVTSYQNTGLLPRTTYFYRVRAFNTAGNSVYANTAFATTQNAAPFAPSGLAAEAISPTAINLVWLDHSTNEDGFRIERKTGAAGTWSQIASVGPDATVHQDTGLSPETTYFYRVRAFNVIGNSAYSNEASATTPRQPTPPAAPSNLTIAVVSWNRVDLSWSDNSDNESGFKIERKTGPTGAWVEIERVGVDATVYQDAAVSPGVVYVYRIRAFNAQGDSPYSATARAWVPPPPRIESATASDVNGDDMIEAGDQLVLTLDRSVVLSITALQANHFFLAVEGDSLGTTGFEIGANPRNARQIVLTLGAGASLTPAGDFSTATVTPGSPSGIDFAASLPPGSVMSLDGVSAVDGGVPGVDDSGVDLQFSMVSRLITLGPPGGIVPVVDSVDAAYTRHEFQVPPGALATSTTFRLRAPLDNLGHIGAVQLESDNPTLTYDPPATIQTQYRPGDVDYEGGQLESEVRVHHLVPSPAGGLEYVPFPGAHSVDMQRRLVSVLVSNPNPAGRAHPLEREAGLGTIGTFAGIPVDTVDERSVAIKPKSLPGIGKYQDGYVLAPGPRGAYTLHRIEFPGYEETTLSDPDRLVVTIRTATLAEKISQTGGQSFPALSGAVFVVTIEDASGQPVEFTSPVSLTVQFKTREDPLLGDLLLFSGTPSVVDNMRVAHDQVAGSGVSFAFVNLSSCEIDSLNGTVTVTNLGTLTGSDGKGTFGAVASEFFTPAAHWSLYR